MNRRPIAHRTPAEEAAANGATFRPTPLAELAFRTAATSRIRARRASGTLVTLDEEMPASRCCHVIGPKASKEGSSDGPKTFSTFPSLSAPHPV